MYPMTYMGPQDSSSAGAAQPGALHSLRRSTTDHVVAGVAGGLAQYLNVDPLLVRAGFVVGSLLLGGVGGPLVYLLAWAVVPEQGKTTSIASERLGTPPWLH